MPPENSMFVKRRIFCDAERIALDPISPIDSINPLIGGLLKKQSNLSGLAL